jgi:site-specific DNA-methyltransferase (adenine-specific)
MIPTLVPSSCKTSLLLGDCLERMDLIPNGSVDLILADPPYGTTACKWDAVIPFEPMWKQAWRVLKPNGAAVFTASQPFTSALVMSQIEAFKYDWSWDKANPSGHLNAKKMPLRRHEDVLVFSKGGVTYNPCMRTGKFRKKGGRKDKDDQVYGKCAGEGVFNDQYYPTSILEISNAAKAGKVHPTQKPVALMEYLIRTYTNEGEMVLDFTMGSGTTGVACMNTGRRFIGIERDEGYFKIAQKRIETAMGILVP